MEALEIAAQMQIRLPKAEESTTLTTKQHHLPIQKSETA
jgi:hypothetical protein